VIDAAHGLGTVSRSDPAAWRSFLASWERLDIDRYMADEGAYRLRRYSVLSCRGGGDLLEVAPHEPHYQSIQYNPINGGIERHFLPFEPDTLANPCLSSITRFAVAVARELRGIDDWRVQAHQFRILALAGESGLPTPEGVHRDGADYVLIVLVARHNVTGGVTTLCNRDGSQLQELLLREPLDALLLDDARTRHGVSPIARVSAEQIGYRDALVLTLHAQNSFAIAMRGF